MQVIYLMDQFLLSSALIKLSESHDLESEYQKCINVTLMKSKIIKKVNGLQLSKV